VQQSPARRTFTRSEISPKASIRQETEEQEEVKFTNKFGKKDFSRYRS
jgi:hypothetical protein